MRLLARLGNLIRGTFGRWIGEREHRNPAAVYEAAIQERSRQYAKLRQAAAGIIYMRQKLERELSQRSDELARVRRQLEIAVERDDDPRRSRCWRGQESLSATSGGSAGNHAELTTEAEAATQNLDRLPRGNRPLRDERARTMVRLANAKARLRLHETLSGLSPEADIQALGEVRDHVNRLVAKPISCATAGIRRSRSGSAASATPRRSARPAHSSTSSSALAQAALVPMVLAPQVAPVAAGALGEARRRRYQASTSARSPARRMRASDRAW
jgi:phage shock protein A